MDFILRAAIGFLLMTTAAIVGDAVAGHQWSAAGGWFLILGVPLLLMAMIPLPDFRWLSILGGAAGVALGLGVFILLAADTSDSGSAALWLYLPWFIAMGFASYWLIGTVLKGVHRLISLYQPR